MFIFVAEMLAIANKNGQKNKLMRQMYSINSYIVYSLQCNKYEFMFDSLVCRLVKCVRINVAEDDTL